MCTLLKLKIGMLQKAYTRNSNCAFNFLIFFYFLLNKGNLGNFNV
jgi:hypothetical protein